MMKKKKKIPPEERPQLKEPPVNLQLLMKTLLTAKTKNLMRKMPLLVEERLMLEKLTVKRPRLKMMRKRILKKILKKLLRKRVKPQLEEPRNRTKEEFYTQRDTPEFCLHPFGLRSE